ncbi:MAG TPA: mannose-1-phosphate guanylyltransferase [Planctomycetota bacterium]|nr:mannose-1-phosphate guanylyltransferase [Planctomycetota bacterium]
MLHAVVMAGGSGKRFWPLSRHDRPKQVLPIAGARPMIAETIARLEGLVPVERTCIVTHESQVAPILSSLAAGPLPQVIAEPCGRDTAACIGLAAVHLRRADPDAVMLVMPADQVIRPAERFREVMRAAVEVAGRGDALVTFGIKPRYPATGYGYIHRGAKAEEVQGIPVFSVRRFREKPAREVAEDYVASGEYYWNSGIFCWRVSVVLDCLRRFVPKLYAALERIGGAIATPAEAVVLREAYEPLERISIDYAVMERAETIRVVEADFEWSDVGSWESVARLRRDEADAHGNVAVGACELLDVANTLVIGDEDHLVAVIGLDDLIVVRTPDATLICPRHRAEEVKQLVERLKRDGLDRYL